MVNDEKLLVTPLAYIRGRSLSNVIFIVDEAQNLTPHEVKAIITRAGENTKIIKSCITVILIEIRLSTKEELNRCSYKNLFSHSITEVFFVWRKGCIGFRRS